MPVKQLLAGVFALAMVLSSSANATIFNLQAVLDGAQADAGNGTGSTATGTAQLTFDDASGQFSWSIAWQGLLGAVTAAHFHGPASHNMSAGIVLDVLDPSINPMVGNAVLTNGQASQLLSGKWYINIHSDRDRGGEIRGQVLRVPEPLTATLLLAGLVGMSRVRSRR
jgi:hypothetical protein